MILLELPVFFRETISDELVQSDETSQFPFESSFKQFGLPS